MKLTRVRIPRPLRNVIYPFTYAVVIIALFYLLQFRVSQALLFGIMMYIILAQSINLLFGFTGYLPFGLGAFFATGAYTFAILIYTWNWTVQMAIVVALIASAASGALLAPLTKLKGAYYAISSLVMMFIFQTIVVNLPPWIAQDVTDISLVKIYNPDLTYLFTIGGVVVTILTIYFIKTSKFGLAFQAIRDDEPVAAMAGVKVVRYKALASIITATLAGYAGIMYAWYSSYLYPESTFDINIPTLAIIMALFGGLRTITGPILSSAILYTIMVYLSSLLGGEYILLYVPIFSIFLIVIVLFLPHGLMRMLYRRSRLSSKILK